MTPHKITVSVLALSLTGLVILAVSLWANSSSDAFFIVIVLITINLLSLVYHGYHVHRQTKQGYTIGEAFAEAEEKRRNNCKKILFINGPIVLCSGLVMIVLFIDTHFGEDAAVIATMSLLLVFACVAIRTIFVFLSRYK